MHFSAIEDVFYSLIGTNGSGFYG